MLLLCRINFNQFNDVKTKPRVFCMCTHRRVMGADPMTNGQTITPCIPDYRTKPVSVCIHKYRNGKLEFEYGCVCMCMPNLADEQTGLEIISWARVKRPGWHSQRKTGLDLSQHTVLQKDVTTKLPWIISITAVSHMQPRSIQGQEGEMIRHLNLADF